MRELNNTDYWIDTHCHLNLPDFLPDQAAVIDRARQANVCRMIVPGIDLESSETAMKMAEAYPAVFFAVGVHPNESADWDDSRLKDLKILATHPKCIAVGEIGLDFYREFCPPAQQLRSLHAQLELAEEIGKPVILHCRQAFEVLWQVLQDWHRHHSKNIGVLHAFEESPEAAAEVTAQGFYVGIGGAYTYKKKKHLSEVLKTVSPDKILLETDSPYLTPVPYRGQRNEPMYIPLIAEKVASTRNISTEALSEIVRENTFRLFGNL